MARVEPRHNGGMTGSLSWVLSRIVAPALDQVLPDDPITHVRLVQCPSPYANDELLPNAVCVELEVAGESFVYVAYDPETFSTTEDARQQLVSVLADFVAESKFGWGQQRV